MLNNDKTWQLLNHIIKGFKKHSQHIGDYEIKFAIYF